MKTVDNYQELKSLVLSSDCWRAVRVKSERTGRVHWVNLSFDSYMELTVMMIRGVCCGVVKNKNTAKEIVDIIGPRGLGLDFLFDDIKTENSALIAMREDAHIEVCGDFNPVKKPPKLNFDWVNHPVMKVAWG